MSDAGLWFPANGVCNMPTNRVEDLEATVDELEATVRGLTEELVETKERVRILEAELEEERATDSDVESVDEMLTPDPGDATGDRSEAEQEDVEQAAARARNEGAKDHDAEGGDDNEESELGDDIIVA